MSTANLQILGRVRSDPIDYEPFSPYRNLEIEAKINFTMRHRVVTKSFSPPCFVYRIKKVSKLDQEFLKAFKKVSRD